MILSRVFSWDGRSEGEEPGGPFYVPRQRQGSGRHDNPSEYGALYCSLDPVSCVAECLQPFRNQRVNELDFRRPEGRRLALARIECAPECQLADLDDPQELLNRNLRPARVATFDRHLTQSWAVELFKDDRHGFLWWSTLESSWINCTLFAERSRPHLSLREQPRMLTLNESEVQAAGRKLGLHWDASDKRDRSLRSRL